MCSLWLRRRHVSPTKFWNRVFEDIGERTRAQGLLGKKPAIPMYAFGLDCDRPKIEEL